MNATRNPAPTETTRPSTISYRPLCPVSEASSAWIWRILDGPNATVHLSCRPPHLQERLDIDRFVNERMLACPAFGKGEPPVGSARPAKPSRRGCGRAILAREGLDEPQRLARGGVAARSRAAVGTPAVSAISRLSGARGARCRRAAQCARHSDRGCRRRVLQPV